MSKITNDDGYGNTIYNPRSIDWNTFTFPSGYYKHVVSQHEILKPYLISYKYYNTVIYENFLLLVNNVSQPFNLREGVELKIPKLIDIQNFILLNKK
jgi:hypothetical protein